MMTKMDIAKYSLLPGVLPRLLDFFRSGFAHIAYLLAVIYHGVRLLPAHHPYLEPQNFGRFGIRHVIGAAANNLVLDRRHIDQVFVFFVLLMGILLLFGQFALFILSLTLGHPALAGSPLDSAAMWGVPALGTSQDIAAILLDRVFGLRGDGGVGSFFGSCVGTVAADCQDMQGNVVEVGGGVYPWPFHQALHQLMSYYSMGIFSVGVFIILYYITAIVAETAVNGSPFGQRVNKTWTPFRLILFLFLLMPINNGTYANGLNFGQLILMKVVSVGSHFATNSWMYFNFQATAGLASNPYLSQQQDLIAQSNLDIKEVKDFVHFFSMMHTCKEAYRTIYGDTYYEDVPGDFDIGAYIIRSPIDTAAYGTPPGGIDANRPNALRLDGLPLGAAGYNQAAAFNVNGDITIRFGYLAPVLASTSTMDPRFRPYRGNVMPLCGDMTLKISDRAEPGSLSIQEDYFQIIRDAWADTTFGDHGECIVAKCGNNVLGVATNCPENFNDNYLEDRMTNYHRAFTTAITNGIALQQTNGLFDIPNNILERGWAGAALWYNKIAEMNGAITTASFNIPEFTKLPYTLERIKEANQQQNSNVQIGEEFATLMHDITKRNIKIDWDNPEDEDIVRPLRRVHDIFIATEVANGGGHNSPTGHVMIDFVNVVFGTSGIFEMRKNADVHPLAQLSSLGKSMMEAVVRNAGVALSFKMSAIAMKTAKKEGSSTLESISSSFFSLVATTAGMAIILYYILPMMPFLYFFFAVSGWLKSIFEAMVAMPLWALAHLKIDGEGVMGPAAFNGYALLLEIFLRPILILAGLIASISVFSALVGVLNIVFDLIVSNVGGFDTRMENEIVSGTGPAGLSSMLDNSTGAVDEFFFTAMYVILCYMIGLSCFKLVDQIPNQILRWMGLSVTTYNEGVKDPVGQIASTTQRSSILVVNQLKGRASGLAELG